MNLEDYKRLLEVLQKHIQFQKSYLERTNFFEQDHEYITKLNPKITTDYLHGLLDLSEYQRTEKKLIEKIGELENEAKDIG